MMLSPNDVLQTFTAIKLHFSTPSYDYFKYGGQLKHPPKFSKRKDKQFFAWIAKKPDPFGLIVSNLAADPNVWVGNLLHDKARDTYLAWKKRSETLTYTFQTEFGILAKDFPKAFTVDNGQHPIALKLYLAGEVSIETLVITNEIMTFLPNWDKKMENDPIWKSVRLPLLKYRGFLDFNKDTYRKTILSILSETNS